MIAFSNLFDAVYQPWMVGTAGQTGGPGYPTADLRITKPPMSQQLAAQANATQLANAQALQMIRQLRRKQNPTPQERAQGAM